MEVIIDNDLCFGCGLCVDICREVFSMDKDKAVVSVNVVHSENELSCKEACNQCPVAAITII